MQIYNNFFPCKTKYSSLLGYITKYFSKYCFGIDIKNLQHIKYYLIFLKIKMIFCMYCFNFLII